MEKLVVGTRTSLTREPKMSCSSELQGLGTPASRGWTVRGRAVAVLVPSHVGVLGTYWHYSRKRKPTDSE